DHVARFTGHDCAPFMLTWGSDLPRSIPSDCHVIPSAGWGKGPALTSSCQNVSHFQVERTTTRPMCYLSSWSGAPKLMGQRTSAVTLVLNKPFSANSTGCKPSSPPAIVASIDFCRDFVLARSRCASQVLHELCTSLDLLRTDGVSALRLFALPYGDRKK